MDNKAKYNIVTLGVSVSASLVAVAGLCLLFWRYRQLKKKSTELQGMPCCMYEACIR